MNNFEAKYIKISSKYLDKKMQSLEIEAKKEESKEAPSTIQKILASFFK